LVAHPLVVEEGLKQLPTAFNARSEQVAAKPHFRDAFRSARCLVPATGWREYVPAGRAKQPYHFHLGHTLFAFAGLCSRWVAPDGEVIESFTILTTTPRENAAKYHDRMPLVLAPELYDAWLDPKENAAGTLAAAQRRALEAPIEIYASNPVANSTRFEGPEAVEPLDVTA
jgi:putative SOS response-associated peptidase YedK